MAHERRRADIRVAIDRGLAGGFECVSWPGYTFKGYGQAGSGRGRELVLAHRLIWQLAGRDIPSGLELDHACHNPVTCPGGQTCPHRKCINIDHLRLVTRLENMDNSTKKYRSTCKKGHPWVAENIYTAPNGRRRCRVCLYLYNKHYTHQREH